MHRGDDARAPPPSTDDQIQAALSEIEMILIEQGLLPEHEIKFVSPVEQDLQDESAARCSTRPGSRC